jgi:hypothetical protein
MLSSVVVCFVLFWFMLALSRMLQTGQGMCAINLEFAADVGEEA